MKIESVVLDLGNVVFEHRHAVMAKEIERRWGRKLDGPTVWSSLKSHKLSPDDFAFFTGIARVLQLDIPEEQAAKELKEIYWDAKAIIPEAQAFLKTISVHSKYYYLTNTSAINFNSRIDFIEELQFSGGLASFQVGSSKPNPFIYELLIAKYSLNPQRTLFIDDVHVNVETARNLGMQAHHLRNRNEFEHLLLKYFPQ